MSIEIFVAAENVHLPDRHGVFRPGVKGNSREIRRYGGRTMLVSSDKDKLNEDRLVAHLREKRGGFAIPEGVPVRADVFFYVPVPKNWSAAKRAAALAGRIHPVPRPDRGNMLKLLEDALAKAGYMHDDAQIVQGGVDKLYGVVPGYRIVLQALA